VETLYVRSVPKSAKTPEEVLQAVKLSPQDIVDACQAMFDKSE